MIDKTDSSLLTMLQGRVQEVREKRQELTATLKDLEAQEVAFLRALEAEKWRLQSMNRPHQTVGGDTPVSTGSQDQYHTGPKKFVLGALADGGEWSLEELKQMAEEQNLYIPEGQALGRVLHGALMGLRSGRTVEMVRSGVWRLK